MEKLEHLQERLVEFRGLIKELVNNACHGALLAHGFTADDSTFYAQFAGILKLFSTLQSP